MEKVKFYSIKIFKNHIITFIFNKSILKYTLISNLKFNSTTTLLQLLLNAKVKTLSLTQA